MIEIYGAPERIRTSDPQIRRLGQSFEFIHLFCQLTPKAATKYQWVSTPFANRGHCFPSRASPLKEKTADAWRGTDGFSSRGVENPVIFLPQPRPDCKLKTLQRLDFACAIGGA